MTTLVCISRVCSTPIKNDIIREIERRVWPIPRKATRMLGESVSLPEKFHSPFLGGNIEINTSFLCSVFRKSQDRLVDAIRFGENFEITEVTNTRISSISIGTLGERVE